jgi:hypothetical protein
MVLDERHMEEPQQHTPPVFDLKPEPVETGEGEPAKFLVKVGGFPRPRVTWWINGSLVVSVSQISRFIFPFTTIFSFSFSYQLCIVLLTVSITLS